MNKKLETALMYVGTLGAIVSALAYIIIISVLVIGVESSMAMNQLLLVSVIGAVAGVLIVGMLRAQGKIFAEKEENSQKIMKDYFKAINKIKKPKSRHTIVWFMTVATIKDILFKGVTIGATIYFSVTVFMEGSGDFALIGLAFANILMFISFGVLNMRKAYNFYLNEHLSVIEQITFEINKKMKEEDDVIKLQKQEILDSTGTSREE